MHLELLINLHKEMLHHLLNNMTSETQAVSLLSAHRLSLLCPQQINLAGTRSEYFTKPSVYVHRTGVTHVCGPTHSSHAAFIRIMEWNGTRRIESDRVRLMKYDKEQAEHVRRHV